MYDNNRSNGKDDRNENSQNIFDSEEFYGVNDRSEKESIDDFVGMIGKKESKVIDHLERDTGISEKSTIDMKKNVFLISDNVDSLSEKSVNFNREENLLLERKASSALLSELCIESKEQLYSIKMQLKSQENLIEQKEKELYERERKRVHNLDLFSPIYSRSDDTKELLSEIDHIKQKVIQLKQEQQQLKDKVAGLTVASQCIDTFINETMSKDIKSNESKQKFNENGLSILEAQEIERQRIARDLHDTTVQNLTSLVHKSELSIKLIDIDSIRAKLELTSMSNTIKTIINDMRGIIYNLKPMSLDDLGLSITVERYAKRLMELNNIRADVHTNEETKEILPVIKLTLFRIIQEACCNIVKHANATLIDIGINYMENNITVSIKDNGIGFNREKQQAESLVQSSSFGLSIMKERISLLSGTMDIQSEKGLGTLITVSAPLTTCEGDKNE